MTTKTASIQQNKQALPIPAILKTSGLAIGATTLANLALYWTSGLVNPAITQWAGAGEAQIIGANMIYLLVGTAVFTLVAKFTARPAMIYSVLATLGMLGSLWLPISAALGQNLPAGAEPASVATAVVLGLMHIVSYAISTPMLVRLVK